MLLSCPLNSSPFQPLFSGFHLTASRSICLPAQSLFAGTTRRSATRAEGVGCAVAASVSPLWWPYQPPLRRPMDGLRRSHAALARSQKQQRKRARQYAQGAGS